MLIIIQICNLKCIANQFNCAAAASMPWVMIGMGRQAGDETAQDRGTRCCYPWVWNPIISFSVAIFSTGLWDLYVPSKEE